MVCMMYDRRCWFLHTLAWLALMLCWLQTESAYQKCYMCKCYHTVVEEISPTKMVLVSDCSGGDRDYIPYIKSNTKVLDLSDNLLTEVPDGGFLADTIIEVLILRNNKFVNMPNVTDRANVLKHLDMRGNDIMFEPDEGITPGLRNISTFKVETNLLYADSLKDFKGLKVLHLITSMELLPEGLLAHKGIIDSLKTLTLNVTNIERNMLAPLNVTEELNLVLPTTTALPNDLFDSVAIQSSMKSLSIEAPNLNIPDRQLLKNIEKLTDIKLHLDNVESLPYDIFYKFDDGEQLAENMKNRHYLGKITIEGVDTLPQMIFDWVSRLQYLKISGSKPPLPSALLSELKLLRTIVLPNNSFTDVSPDFFSEQARLRHLNMSFNKLPEIEEADFEQMTRLETLDLSHNEIESIHENAFQAMSDNLKALNLSHNRICHLPPKIFAGMSSLEFLSLHFNCLDDLNPGIFSDLLNLKQLHLQVNNISEIPDGLFDNLTSLTVLNLNDNQIVGLKKKTVEKLFQLPLNHIDLSSNKIKYFPVFVPPLHKKLEYFLVSDNPLFCDCGIVPLLKIDQREGVCANPDALKGLEISDLTEDDVCVPTTILPETTVPVMITAIHKLPDIGNPCRGDLCETDSGSITGGSGGDVSESSDGATTHADPNLNVPTGIKIMSTESSEVDSGLIGGEMLPDSETGDQGATGQPGFSSDGGFDLPGFIVEQSTKYPDESSTAEHDPVLYFTPKSDSDNDDDNGMNSDDPFQNKTKVDQAEASVENEGEDFPYWIIGAGVGAIFVGFLIFAIWKARGKLYERTYVVNKF